MSRPLKALSNCTRSQSCRTTHQHNARRCRICSKLDAITKTSRRLLFLQPLLSDCTSKYRITSLSGRRKHPHQGDWQTFVPAKSHSTRRERIGATAMMMDRAAIRTLVTAYFFAVPVQRPKSASTSRLPLHYPSSAALSRFLPHLAPPSQHSTSFPPRHDPQTTAKPPAQEMQCSKPSG